MVIPAFNAEGTISAVVQAAREQDLAEGLEVIVVDDGSSDQTASQAERAGAKVVCQTNRGPAAARNTGWRAARGEVVLFTDSDCRPHKDWAKWSLNPVTGCRHGCKYCYARDIANRYYKKEKFEPTFRSYRLKAPFNTQIPSERKNEMGIHNVFVCSMADLFGNWVPQEWIDPILKVVYETPQWNYIFLTKNPERMTDIAWPDNAWVGTTIDVQSRVKRAEKAFKNIKAKVKFVSCEPLSENLDFSDLTVFNWVIIGARSKSTKAPAMQPRAEWVFNLMNQAYESGCKIYCKPNLKALIKEYPF